MFLRYLPLAGAAGVGFPGFMPPPPGAAAGGPQLQWGAAAGPPAGEGGPPAESSAPMAGNPWLSLQQGKTTIPNLTLLLTKEIGQSF